MNSKKSLLLLVFAVAIYSADSEISPSSSLLPKNCGVQDPDLKEKILAGPETVLGEFPWLALLEYQTPKGIKGLCGGALISSRYVLTAAHCVISQSASVTLKQVRLGDNNLKTDPDCSDPDSKICADPAIVVPVESHTSHEKFEEPVHFRNDIALVRLSHEVQFTKYIQPICLPSSSELHQNYVSAGWGVSKTHNHPDVKHKVELPLADFASCSTYYTKYHTALGEGQMCVGGVLGKGTCKGDGGNPLMREVTGNGSHFVVDGILSFGPFHCENSGQPDVFTKVGDYLPWILDNLKP